MASELDILIFLIFGASAFVFYLLCVHFYRRYKLRKLVGPTPLPIIGNLLQFPRNTTGFFNAVTKWAKEYRDAGYFVIYLGMNPTVVIFNPRDMETLLCDTRLDRKSFQYNFFWDWLKDGLLFSTGSKWAARRRLLTPSFHFAILSRFHGTINDHAQAFTDKLCGLADGSEIDLNPLTTLCSLDTVSETIMGTNPRSQSGHAKEYANAVREMGEIITTRIKNPLYWNNVIFKLTSLGRKYYKHVDILHRTTEKIIRERKRDMELDRDGDVIIDDMTQDVRKRRRLAFLDLLIEAQRQHNAITDEGIQEEVDTFLFEGHDTTASSMATVLYLLARHTDIQRKVHEELDRVFENDRSRPVTGEDLPKLKYLDRVLKESQRLITTVPYVMRDIEVDVEMCGTTLPKDTNVFLGFLWLHRDPEQFPDPMKFDPDRFLPENSTKRHKFAYVPFSAGHRNCIGQKFAVMVQKIILATVLRKLELRSSQTMEGLCLVKQFVMLALNGFNVRLYPR